jgi:hypothetical protein
VCCNLQCLQRATIARNGGNAAASAGRLSATDVDQISQKRSTSRTIRGEAVLKKEIPVHIVRSGAGEGNLNFVRMLIDRGENVNAKNQEGQAALRHVEGNSCRRPEIA